MDSSDNPHTPSLIIDGLLFLGGLESRRDADVLASLGIRHIVDLSSTAHHAPPRFPELNYYTLDGYADRPDTDLRPAIRQVCRIVADAAARREIVLVHCHQGISRSAACTMAFLMQDRKFTLREAFRWVKDRRTVVLPNVGFMAQLAELEEELHGRRSLTIGKWGQLVWHAGTG